jgi:hypothetical protein
VRSGCSIANEEAAVTLGTRNKADEAREREVRRAVLLFKRLNENPPTNVIQTVALCQMVKKVPNDIRAEALKGLPPADHGEAAVTTLEATVKDVVAHLESSAELASELGVSENELREILGDLPADFEERVAAEAARLAQS